MQRKTELVFEWTKKAAHDLGDILEEYGVAIRYPDSRDPSEEDVRDAIDAASKLKYFVIRKFEDEGYKIGKE